MPVGLLHGVANLGAKLAPKRLDRRQIDPKAARPVAEGEDGNPEDVLDIVLHASSQGSLSDARRTTEQAHACSGGYFR